MLQKLRQFRDSFADYCGFSGYAQDCCFLKYKFGFEPTREQYNHYRQHFEERTERSGRMVHLYNSPIFRSYYYHQSISQRSPRKKQHSENLGNTTIIHEYDPEELEDAYWTDECGFDARYGLATTTYRILRRMDEAGVSITEQQYKKIDPALKKLMQDFGLNC